MSLRSLNKGILWSFTALLIVVCPGMAVAQLAPQSQEEFEQRFTGWTLQFDAPDCNEGDGVEPISFIGPGRLATRGVVEIGDRTQTVDLEGDYEYEETGANTGTLTTTVDDLPIPFVWDLTFSSQTRGTFTAAVFGLVVCRGSFELVESRTVQPPQTEEQIYYFPHLAVGAGWQTTLTYINHSSEEVTCRTNFLSDQGSPLMVSFAGRGTVDSRTDVLLPGGSVHEETDVALSAPLAPGWARATCSGAVKASLLFRRHDSQGAPVAEGGVNAATVPATRFVSFAEQGEGRLGTGVAYANPSDTAALVTFTAKDSAGRTLASVERNLLPNGHGAHNMAGLFGLSRFSGSLEITSAEPIVTLSLNFEADPVFSSLPPGELDAAAEGTTTYYFPHLAVGAGWQTTLTYINYSPEQVSCQTDFLSDQGSPLMVSFAGLGTVESRTDVLPPGGSVHEETDVELSAPLAPGWARASCSGPVKASLLFRRFEGGVPTGEAGVNAAAVPATRFVTFAEQGEGRFGTGVAYANPSDAAAQITFTAKDSAGQVLASVGRSLLPNGHGAQNMAPLFALSGFNGSVEITSTEPIVTLSLNFEADPVFSSLPPAETVNPPAAHFGGDPDLTVYSITAFTNPSGIPPGGSFSLAAGVRNVGEGVSPATTLRYYRSTDATITSGDTSVGTDAVSALAPSGLTEESIRLTAPSSAGIYYYGACVDAVGGESRTANNCSTGRRVVVTAGGAEAASGWRIDTFAGTRDVGDNSPATAAWLRGPEGVAVDGAGNLFIADRDNHRIRKVDTAGVITTVAGTGETGFRGDGGPATAARLFFPAGVAVDGAGNLFIADQYNARVRKVDSAGVITTVAGLGNHGFSGDGSPATAARLFFPADVAVDGAGNLFIADTWNQRIRKVDTAGVITTVAGTGRSGFSGDGGPAPAARLFFPAGVAVDGAGNLFIADRGNYRIRKVDTAGVITTVAGTGRSGFSGDGGPAPAARLFFPAGVAVDGAGNLFIADQGNYRIRKVDTAGVITTVAGTGTRGFSGDGGPAADATLTQPFGVAVDGAGNLFFADEGNHRIRKVDAAGVITTVAGTGERGDGGPAVNAPLDRPSDVAADGAGNLFIADTWNQRIRKVDTAGVITTVAGTGTRGFSGDGGPAAAARLNHPGGVAVDGADNLFIADWGARRIRKVDTAGVITTVAGTGRSGFSGDGGPATTARLNCPCGVAVDGAGNLFIADEGTHRIRKVDAAGVITTVAGTGTSGFSGDGGPAVNAHLDRPSDVAVDGAGNLFIADQGNYRIRKVDTAGVITTVAGAGTSGFSGDGGPATAARLFFPAGVAVDGAGNLFIADRGNRRIRRVDTAGVITTVAGTGTCGFSGDGGPATAARLDRPVGVAVDGAGNLFIADSGNHLIRILTPAVH